MGRGGHGFKRHWHGRQLELGDGTRLAWVLIDDPAHRRPHAECFRVVGPDDSSRGVHPSEAVEILRAARHPDAAVVPVDIDAGRGRFH